MVYNLWELKQALRIVREDVIAEHVHDNRNDIAAWVESVVGDAKLAKELQKTTSRWGLIVALERQMMRTVNLPFYVASRWLSTVEIPFHFVDGKTANSMESLKQALDQVEDSVVEFHLERDPNDIAKWVNDIIGDYQLAEILAESFNRQTMLDAVSDHLVMLQDALHCR